ncbi:MAG: NAD(+)/NADH kinase [Oligoflexia bacterium]|nr:NAD(+)/NADH kinase [Oligoflexia bacterium]
MGKKIQSICIVYRPQSEKAFETAQEVSEWLHHQKVKVYLDPNCKALKFAKKAKAASIKKLDFVVALGGDGTFLAAVRWLQGREVPILGVNMGNLGFLTETRDEELFDVLTLALEGKMHKTKRATLETTIKKTGKIKSYTSLNDIVVERGARSRLIDIAVYSNSFFVSNVKADGLIVASPTGSTAYCLAAGGPIIHPSVNAVSITPVCPHTLTNRPLILNDHHKIKLKLNEVSGRAALLVDGQKVADLTSQDEVVVTRGKPSVIMLTLPSRNYFDILRAKLRFGQRE